MSRERFLPCIVSEEAGIICDSSDVRNGVIFAWNEAIKQSTLGVNERIIIEEEKLEDGSISLTLELLQFYPTNILIDYLGLK